MKNRFLLCKFHLRQKVYVCKIHLLFNVLEYLLVSVCEGRTSFKGPVGLSFFWLVLGCDGSQDATEGDGRRVSVACGSGSTRGRPGR